jgi:hypothetical protein
VLRLFIPSSPGQLLTLLLSSWSCLFQTVTQWVSYSTQSFQIGSFHLVIFI